MSTFDLSKGRTSQKLRTRQQLLQATRELLDEGKAPSIEAVAEQAGVSRATAYRYFANTEKLVFEAGLDAAWHSLEFDPSKLHPSDVVQRVMQLHAAMWKNGRETEPAFRRFLGSALAEWVETGGKSDSRGGRRLLLIDIALEPVKEVLEYSEYNMLRHSLAGMLGADMLVSLRDICKLDYEEAERTSRWAVMKLLESAIR